MYSIFKRSTAITLSLYTNLLYVSLTDQHWCPSLVCNIFSLFWTFIIILWSFVGTCIIFFHQIMQGNFLLIYPCPWHVSSLLLPFRHLVGTRYIQYCGSKFYTYFMSVKSSTELMLYVVLTMPTLNKAYLFIYLFIIR